MTIWEILINPQALALGPMKWRICPSQVRYNLPEHGDITTLTQYSRFVAKLNAVRHTHLLNIGIVPSTSSFDRRPLSNMGFGGSGGGFGMTPSF